MSEPKSTLEFISNHSPTPKIYETSFFYSKIIAGNITFFFNVRTSFLEYLNNHCTIPTLNLENVGIEATEILSEVLSNINKDYIRVKTNIEWCKKNHNEN